MSVNPDIPLYLFARAPVPGQVKTRMQPNLTAPQAARLATMMLVQSVEKIAEHWPGSMLLAVTPDENHSCFKDLKNHYPIDFEIQIKGELGQRMYHVLEKAISKCGSCVVMGCDIPQISGEILAQVYARMSARKNIIGPATDGGFYILGLCELNHQIFDQVIWGGDQVLVQTLENLKRLGIDTEFCRELRDIDDWNDLCWLAGQERSYQDFVNNIDNKRNTEMRLIQTSDSAWPQGPDKGQGQNPRR